ncbi:MAG: hypothetical protein PHY93_18165 [Bacteriovorax sp.]|nr:hypothetical protein [Bacteriovorax sp.]
MRLISKLGNTLISFICCLPGVMAMEIPCDQLPRRNIEVTEKVYQVQLLKLHKKGIEIPDTDFSGPGICYSVAMSGKYSEEQDFTYQVLGTGGGSGRFVYLEKQGQKHAMVFRANSYSSDEAVCQMNIQRDISLAQGWIQSSEVNKYDPSIRAYSFKEGPWSYSVENREIRMLADGKGVTVNIANNLGLQYTICYFSKH